MWIYYIPIVKSNEIYPLFLCTVVAKSFDNDTNVNFH